MPDSEGDRPYLSPDAETKRIKAVQKGEAMNDAENIAMNDPFQKTPKESGTWNESEKLRQALARGEGLKTKNLFNSEINDPKVLKAADELDKLERAREIARALQKAKDAATGK